LTGFWLVFAAAWPMAFLVVGFCSRDWGKRGGL
jgi:hypothetical protein